MSFNSNTTGVTSRAGALNTSGVPQFTLSFSGVRVPQSSVFCVVLCQTLFVFRAFFFFYSKFLFSSDLPDYPTIPLVTFHEFSYMPFNLNPNKPFY